MLYSVTDLRSLCVVKSVESSNKIACYSSYTLKRHVCKVIINVNKVAVYFKVDSLDSLFRVKLLRPVNI